MIIANKIFRELKDEKKIGQTLNKIGLIWWKKGDFKKSLKYQLEALNLSDKVDDKIKPISKEKGTSKALFVKDVMV